MPAAPLVTRVGGDTGPDAADGVTSDPTLVVRGTADPFTTVAVSRNRVTPLGVATADADGKWEFDYTAVELAEGAYYFSVAAADLAEPLVGRWSEPFVVTVDRTAPRDPVRPDVLLEVPGQGQFAATQYSWGLSNTYDFGGGGGAGKPTVGALSVRRRPAGRRPYPGWWPPARRSPPPP